MLKKTLAILTALPLFLISAAYGSDNSTISARIDSIVRNCLPDGTDISVHVWDLDNDCAVYAHRENVLNRPASTMKVLTSYTALKSLGRNYNFETQLKTDAQTDTAGILSGNLYLVGGLDPQLMEGDLWKLVTDLKESGIKRIDGDIIADVSIMDSIYWGSGWAWDDTPSSFQPYISPLTVHGGYIGIYIAPGTRGAAPKVQTFPVSNYYTIDNQARTGVSSLGPLSIKREWLNNSNTIVIRGNCTKSTSTEQNIYDSDDFTFCLFREYLDQSGIEYNGYGWGQCPSQATTLTSVSHTLCGVMKEALKESVNLDAEAMLLQSAHRGNSAVSFSEAAKYMDKLLRRDIGECNGFNIADGSGLSMYDYVPASLFVNVLRLIYKDREMYDIIYGCLPIAGHDGTLKGRMETGPTAGNIHAKTGTITGSCTLAGYARTSEGRNLAFCIMNSSAIKMAPSRKVQDAICTILCE